MDHDLTIMIYGAIMGVVGSLLSSLVTTLFQFWLARRESERKPIEEVHRQLRHIHLPTDEEVIVINAGHPNRGLPAPQRKAAETGSIALSVCIGSLLVYQTDDPRLAFTFTALLSFLLTNRVIQHLRFTIFFGGQMKNKSSIVLLCALIVLFSLACKFLAGSSLKFGPDTLPNARVGQAYETEIHVSENHTPVGGASLSKGALPAGLQLVKAEDQEDTLKISGIPAEAGTFTFTVSVWCYGTNVSGDTGEKEYSIEVEE